MFTLPFNLLWSGLVENYNTIASSYLRILDAMFEWELLVLDITSLPTDYYLHDSHGIFALSWLRFIFAAKMFYLLWMFVALVLMNLFIGTSLLGHVHVCVGPRVGSCGGPCVCGSLLPLRLG